MKLLLCGWAVLLSCGLPASAQATEVHPDFSEGFAPWTPLDSGSWTIQKEDGVPVVVLTEPGVQRPPVRRPTAYLLLPDRVWSNLEITLQARSLEPDSVVNRDVVVIFGYVDETHFYYAHLASSTDDTKHNVIMKVTGDRRVVIDRETLPEARLSGQWCTIRVRHREDGEISVYIDDLESPLMTAIDSDYPAGLVGFGTFNDRAAFRGVSVSGDVDD